MGPWPSCNSDCSGLSRLFGLSSPPVSSACRIDCPPTMSEHLHHSSHLASLPPCPSRHLLLYHPRPSSLTPPTLSSFPLASSPSAHNQQTRDPNNPATTTWPPGPITSQTNTPSIARRIIAPKGSIPRPHGPSNHRRPPRPLVSSLRGSVHRQSSSSSSLSSLYPPTTAADRLAN